ncbi:hypothetical protein ANCCAN_05920 [Ancylostoma caninum]|uniref:Guanylate cyclase domain-containing protein n=1 Tax=Ancylostoma caninum TaxID=29170 RepID=A0A368GUE0_ANCCA|nr:hypothetical protein ANCCAN_05920 [Ancylostoma caninum]
MIHISAAANNLLQEVGGYETEPRGEVIIKGKGVMETFWLLGPASEGSSSQPHSGFNKPNTRSALEDNSSLLSEQRESK